MGFQSPSCYNIYCCSRWKGKDLNYDISHVFSNLWTLLADLEIFKLFSFFSRDNLFQMLIFFCRKYDQPSRLTPEQQLARYHRQFTCEAVSLIVLIIAVTFLIATPFILVPMVALPEINHDLIRVLLCLSLLLSVIFTIIGAFIGNVYWYFDEESSTFRWRLHFGSGPKHYWGTTLFNFTNNQSNQGANVHNQPPKQSHYNSAINNV